MLELTKTQRVERRVLSQDRLLNRLAQPGSDGSGWVAALCMAGAVAAVVLGWVLQ